MTIYARMSNGLVVEIIEPVLTDDGAELPIEQRFHPDFVAQLIVYDPDNPPTPPAPPVPPHAVLVEQAKAEIRVQRQPIISVLDGLQVSAIAKGEGANALAIETAKQGLRDLTDIDLSGCAGFEAMRLAVKARYAALAGALPVNVRKAFSEALS